MSRVQQWTVGIVGFLMAAAVAGLGLVAGDSGGPNNDDVSVLGVTRERTSVPDALAPRVTAPSTTYAMVPVPPASPVPTTAPPPAVITVQPPPRRASVVPQGVVAGADGAVLTPPANPTPRAIDKLRGCNSAGDPGWTIVECGALQSQGMVMIWLIESRGAGRRVLVLREQTGGLWAPVLAVADDDGSRYVDIGVKGEDVSGDGQPELSFGFRRAGAGRVLDVDVVSAPGVVALHRTLAGGSARVAKGQVDTWEALPEGTAVHSIFRFSGSWRMVSSSPVAADAVPPSMV